MYRDKFIFGLNNDAMRAELLKTHLKPDNTPKSMADVVTEAKFLESAYTANKLIADSSKSTIEERVHWVRHIRNEATERAWNMSLVWRQTGTSPMETMPSQGQNMLLVWY